MNWESRPGTSRRALLLPGRWFVLRSRLLTLYFLGAVGLTEVDDTPPARLYTFKVRTAFSAIC